MNIIVKDSKFSDFLLLFFFILTSCVPFVFSHINNVITCDVDAFPSFRSKSGKSSGQSEVVQGAHTSSGKYQFKWMYFYLPGREFKRSALLFGVNCPS